MESWHDKITIFEFLKALFSHFGAFFLIFKPQIFAFMWATHRLSLIVFILSFVWLFLAIYYLVISAFIFNFFIVPNIERKICKKVGYHPIDEYIWLGKWMNRQYETASYIVYCYYNWKFKKTNFLPTYFNDFPLKIVNYPIESISKTELFFSMLILISMMAGAVLTFILGIFIMFLNFFPKH